MILTLINSPLKIRSSFLPFLLSIGITLGINTSSGVINAAELPEIIQRGKLIVGVKTDVRPLGFRDAQGNLQGLEIDIAKRLAELILGNPDAIAFESVKNQDRLQVILDNKVDLVIAKVTVNPSRSRLVEFSPHYYLDSTGIITKQADLKSLSDLKTRRIGVLNGSNAIALMRSELPTAQLVGVNSYQEALNLLETGKIDGFAADHSVLTGWVQEKPDYHTLPVQLSQYAIAVVMPKGQQYWGLRETVNGAINEWRKSGWLKERAKYWGLSD
jgi:polar amino acid transport system substrate-binding protein